MIRPGAPITPHKREQKLELPRGGGRSRTSGSPWLWTLGVTHCGRFFFFFFFFFFFLGTSTTTLKARQGPWFVLIPPWTSKATELYVLDQTFMISFSLLFKMSSTDLIYLSVSF
eukprot:FR736338.1.p2 GENE.FR736338.1~~FR736338.1.p2  ORF type:complete len:114 (-),score=31.83 FR736338.1:484-825(-)